eukprot:TRINITY_DN25316_c0_g1_i1.p1 TRINITY_DN25316_c0_g1~~TRINITY_DN25316_c0_g1_i1.p1  ORF type:complete len:386 (+),score=52.87 TRINITY_DN25316_c0_g1_i1:59-1216(+)
MFTTSKVVRCPLSCLIGTYLAKGKVSKSDGWAAKRLRTTLVKPTYENSCLQSEINALGKDGFHVGKYSLAVLIEKSKSLEDAEVLIKTFPELIQRSREVQIGLLKFAGKRAHFNKFLGYFEQLPHDNRTFLVFAKVLAQRGYFDQIIDLFKIQQRTQSRRVSAPIFAEVINMATTYQELTSLLEKGHSLQLLDHTITEAVIRCSIKLGEKKCRNLIEWVMEGSFGTPAHVPWLDPISSVNISSKNDVEKVLDAIQTSVTNLVPKRVCTSPTAWGGLMYYNAVVGFPKETIRLWQQHFRNGDYSEIPLPAAKYILRSFGLLIAEQKKSRGEKASREYITLATAVGSHHESLSVLQNVVIRGNYQHNTTSKKVKSIITNIDHNLEEI